MWILQRLLSQDWSILGILWSVLGGIGVGLAFTQVTSLATTIGLHRGMTHKSFQLHPLLNWLIRLLLWLTVGIKWWEWCRVHAYHHRHTETEQDGHSPMFKGGLSGVLLHNPSYYQKCANDPVVIAATGDHFQPDRWDEWLFDREAIGRWTGIALCALVFGAIPGIVAYVIHILVYIYLNAAINSLGHGAIRTNVEGRLERLLAAICRKTGRRPGFDATTAKSGLGNTLNLRWLALITMGEGLHYNHHCEPRSATMRRYKGDIDLALPFLYCFSVLGLIRGLEVRPARARP